MRAQVETITPAKAQKWLDKTEAGLAEAGLQQRCVSTALVSRIAHDIRSGNWMVNGEALILSSAGVVLDGQHRLHAIIKAGIQVESLVVHGASTESFSTIDGGKSRTPADILGIAGIDDANHLARALRFLHRYHLSRFRGKGIVLTNAEVCDFAAQHPAMAESIAFIKKHRGGGSLMSAGSTTFLHYIFAQVNRRDANQFMRQVVTGEDVQAGTAAYMLRERLLKERIKTRGRLATVPAIAMAIKAWNYDRDGVCPQVLTWRGKVEEFPNPH